MFRATVFFLAGVISYLVTGWLITAPDWLRALDVPNERSSHANPTPRIGGLGVVSGFVMIMPLLWIMLLPRAVNWLFATKFAIALLSYIIIATVGLIDDMRRIGAFPKYLGQLIAALITIWGGAIFTHMEIPHAGLLTFGWAVGGIITIVWLTGFSNFFNFMDGIDGMAGGVGAIYSLALAYVSFGTGHRLIGAGCLIMAASCLGFLAHNFPPAKIFMGDVGSLFVGFALAAFALLTTNSGERPAPFIAILLIFGTFIYDAAFTICRRIKGGEKLYTAHRSHLYQRLVIAGQSHRRVSLTYYAMSAALGCGGMLYTFAGDRLRVIILLLSASLLIAFTVYVYRYEASMARVRRVYPREGSAEPIEG